LVKHILVKHILYSPPPRRGGGELKRGRGIKQARFLFLLHLNPPPPSEGEDIKGGGKRRRKAVGKKIRD